ncbi:DNA polymerase kappa [Chionoecetes opilio]|uniref:DNA polymerase kappa n=1 Tax=Chionoecetes opilio TaxID=41210 RepID=A0A8J8WFK6_CHIOP|nr:DNA polymerase kappa [Chionoecetes opilio]
MYSRRVCVCEGSQPVHRCSGIRMGDTVDIGQKGAMAASPGLKNLCLNTHKAGMQGLDTDKINDIIKRASEGSRFYQYKQKHQQQLNEKLEVMKNEASSFTEEQIKKATKQMDQLVQELEAERDLSRTIVHVDMDMFYAAVEMRDDPSLRDKPMAVGSTGMLSTSNYAARRYGVRAAMPGFIGKKLCPELIIVPPDFTKYKAASREVQEIFSQYDPGFSPMSLDEAYLDITEFLQKNSALYVDEDDGMNHEQLSQVVVKEMRGKIEAKTQLTASAGIAANTRLAKVCSDLNKPNGQYYLPQDRDHILQFIASLSIRKVCGIGNVSEQHLQALGVTQCGQLMEKRGLLRLLFSETSYYNFLSIVLGLGHSTLSAWTERDRKSISQETTFKGTSDRPTLFKLSADLCQELADEMQRKDIVGKVLTLKIKTTDFKVKTRAQTLSEATRCPQVMAAGIKKILLLEMNAATDQPLSLRLLGVRMSSLAASEVGQRRQATLTQMFSQAAKPKAASTTSTTLPHTEQQPHQSERGTSRENVETRSDNNMESSALVKEKISPCRKETPSIEHFLSKPKLAEVAECTRIEVYECSVCEEVINVESLEAFNQHLDTCLELHSSPPVRDSKTDNNCINRDKTVTESQKNEDGDPHCKETSGGKIQSDIFPVDNCNSNHGPSTSSLKQDLLCPVCEQRSFRDVTSLNTHMDECLNKAAISELLQEVPDRPLKTDTAKNQTSKKRRIRSSQWVRPGEAMVTVWLVSVVR